MLGQLNPGEAF